MTFNNTYYALKSNTGKFLAIVDDSRGSLFIYDEELKDHNMQHILHEHKEDAEHYLDALKGNSLIKFNLYFDEDVSVDRIVEVEIKYEVNVNELT